MQAFLQRDLVSVPPAPVAPQPIAPTDDPSFTKVTSQIGDVAKGQKSHPSAKASVAEAQGAAVAPPNDVAAQAGASQMDKMAGAKPGTFDKAAFIAAVGKAIDAAAPKTPDEAADLKSSGKSGQVKAQVEGMVGQGKDASAKDIKGATDAPPDTSTVTPKAVTAMPPADPGAPPPAIAAGSAMPSPRGPEQTNLDAGPASVNNKMAEANVTDEQLAKSNEPQFTKALDSKQNLATQSAAAPPQVQGQEAQILGQAKGDAAGSTVAALTVMHQTKTGAIGAVGAHKNDAKSADEAKRAEISAHIEEVFTKTKTDVGQILDGLDKSVGDAFDSGEKAARESFDANVGKEMDAWKDDRYSGITGAAQWLADKFEGAPPEVNEIFARNRTAYVAQMGTVISNVADIVGSGLGKATQRIADGRAEVKKYVADQPAALRQFAGEAEGKMSSQFDSLDSDVTSKQDSLVSDLAQKYTAATKSVDDAITKMQEENKGLVDEVEAAVGGVIETIEKLMDWIKTTAQRIAGSVDKILADPISFLSKLVTAVEHGFTGFVANIGTHLEQGFKAYLLGTLGSAGIRIPDELDFKGILMMLVDLFGLTWEHIKGRILAKLGPKAAKAWGLIEKGIDFVKTIADKGVEGIWEMLVDKIGDLKQLVIEKIKSFVVTEVIQKGVEWVLSLLNPAGAFIQAVEMIIHIVEFFIDKGAQIKSTVDGILDSVESLLSGGEGGVPARIEQTLAGAIPTVIAFLADLADLAGLGGIADTIKEMVTAAQSYVDKGIDWVVDKVIGLVKGAWAALVGKGGADKQDAGADDKSKQHEAIAAEAAAELERPVEGEEDKPEDEAKADRVSQAQVLEAKYQPQIEEGVKISIHLGSPSAEGNSIPFNVVIAPNTTTTKGSAPLGARHKANAAGTIYVVREGGKFMLHPDFRGNKAFRSKLYGAFDVEAKAFKAVTNTVLSAEILRGIFPKDPLWGAIKREDWASMYACPGVPGLTHAHMANSTLSNQDPTLDHGEEVANHWNSAGHNLDQEARTGFYSTLDNLTPICRACNSKKKGPDLIYSVGPDFRGRHS